MSMKSHDAFVIVFIIQSEKYVNSKTLQQIFRVHEICFYCLLEKPDYISQHPLHTNVALWPSSDQRIFFEVEVQHFQYWTRKQLIQVISTTSLPLLARGRQTITSGKMAKKVLWWPSPMLCRDWKYPQCTWGEREKTILC